MILNLYTHKLITQKFMKKIIQQQLSTTNKEKTLDLFAFLDEYAKRDFVMPSTFADVVYILMRGVNIYNKIYGTSFLPAAAISKYAANLEQNND